MRSFILLIFISLASSAFVQAQCVEGDCENGSGVFKYSGGAEYQGEFKDGMRDGNGTFQFADGRIYNGQWSKKFPDGEGKMIYVDGNERIGYWAKGKFVGKEKPVEDLVSKGGDVVVDSLNSLTIGDEDMLTIEDLLEHGLVEEQEYNPSDIEIYAVIVGVADYPSMPKLEFTDDDAKYFYNFLRSPEGGALPNDHIALLTNDDAKLKNIEGAMRSTFVEADSNDVILLYFSGHGLKNAFLPIDFDGQDNKLLHDDVNLILEESAAKHKICIADACHSGGLGRTRSMRSADQMLKAYYKGFEVAEGGTALLLSSKQAEISLESNGLKHGVFSHYLIEGLSGAADLNEDKLVTIKELFDFVHSNVKEYTSAHQTPIIRGNFDDQMPVGVIR